MDENILKKIEETQRLLEDVYVSVEKTRKLFFWMLIISVTLFVLPLLGLAVALPGMISVLGGDLGGL
ncbi:MAG: hypothetical protein A3I44_06220 [Candidatus Sungbacteria bacterium RIFCSPLOWO2_02_FULL_51_17]|uniref:Uncharacterized protein n=1 Tax=Candidatus Sungbacteria bacterium RIFCSPHIGHO2_02_FULL_51_29 TaxID=1802273 RepID=A0A1G2KT38_9BACT|nr:MAG: hypothetical protein A2676_04535 [Candidatus Sungbacteria bacterium RIFCSPHIGHO2_01_FULL_51_22]OHA01621.1 MAG: hypothetical protein A3C16_02595 [Candidatus Sungbacteria bacterium RIFCSPHIGHO2_02_FULL_51_29]OHA06433.1 MAG: hypothetical protein A3B29_04685 [Candidatus Sungbacteria bacterium RIFCSPLOWO2_01_FULL_51_34]OHA10371.1 MAG: hypothetical protein A3I44_06220 [Candidatus Sungbacteria bacterium RIFCSPLOWO2_02_FULL_51_17]